MTPLQSGGYSRTFHSHGIPPFVHASVGSSPPSHISPPPSPPINAFPRGYAYYPPPLPSQNAMGSLPLTASSAVARGQSSSVNLVWNVIASPPAQAPLVPSLDGPASNAVVPTPVQFGPLAHGSPPHAPPVQTPPAQLQLIAPPSQPSANPNP